MSCRAQTVLNAARTHCVQGAATASRPAQQGFLESTPPVCQQAVTARAAALMAHKLTYTGVEVFAEMVTEEDLRNASTAVGSSVIGRCCRQCVELCSGHGAIAGRKVLKGHARECSAAALGCGMAT